jgi:hypothetical protein
LSAAKDVVPAPPLEALRQLYQRNARQSLWFAAELLRVLDHLESHGIQALPYKGPALAQLLYGDVTQRQFGDLDLLVHPCNLTGAKAALVELGYKPNLQLTAAQEHAYLRSGYEYTFDSAHGRNLVEMQWQILPRFYAIDFDVDGLFKRSAIMRLGGRDRRTLGNEDLLLVLCAHAAKHVWEQLSLLCDIAQLARLPQMDWMNVQQQAQRLGIERIVAVNFMLAKHLLDAPVPDALQNWISVDKTDAKLAEELLPIVAAAPEVNSESITYFRLMARLREHARHRARFYWRLFSTPSVGEWSSIRLSSQLSPLYRVVRAFRLLRRIPKPL